MSLKMCSHHMAVRSMLVLYFLFASGKSFLLYLCMFSCGITHNKPFFCFDKTTQLVELAVFIEIAVLSQHRDAVFPVSLQC